MQGNRETFSRSILLEIAQAIQRTAVIKTHYREGQYTSGLTSNGVSVLHGKAVMRMTLRGENFLPSGIGKLKKK